MFVMRLYSSINAVGTALKRRIFQFPGAHNALSLMTGYVILSLILLTWPLMAQDADSTLDKSSKTLVAMPLINNNPTMKTGFGGI